MTFKLLSALCVLALAAAAPQAPSQTNLLREYENRLRSTNQQDSDQLLDLAAWCQAMGLHSQARMLFLRVIRLDPENEEARLALGHRKEGDRWVAGGEAGGASGGAPGAGGRAAPSAPASGAAMPSEDVLRRMVREDMSANRMITDTLIQRYVDEMGVDRAAFNAGRSRNMLVLTKDSMQEVENLNVIGESVLARLNTIVHGDTAHKSFRDAVPHITYLIEGQLRRDSLYFIAKEHPTAMSKEAADGWNRDFTDRGLSSSFPQPLHVMVGMERDTGRERGRSTVANSVGHHWLTWNMRPALNEPILEGGKFVAPPTPRRTSLLSWLKEAVGIWSSVEEIGVNLTYRITRSVYAGDVGRARREDPSTVYMELCYEYATDRTRGRGRPFTFYGLTKTELNELDDLALAVSWSVVDYLIRERQDRFRAMVQLGGRLNSFRAVFIEVFGTEEERGRRREIKEDRDLDDLYRAVAHRFEQEWREWVKNHSAYRIAFEDPGKATPRERRRFPGDEEEEQERGGGRSGGGRGPGRR